MLFSEMSAQDWVLIIAAVFLGIDRIVSLILSRRTNNNIKDVASKVEIIHKATNSLATAMGEAKFSQGVSEGMATGLEQGRAEVRKQTDL